ncbi:hypothetical protein V5799_021370 [Amblyomma americanum]|uniref:Uncharacterized protein n=1 Tax=Amblyomma americanum TaxID=6943 RepID=A0AAQ4FNN1_AMBAM
MASPSKGMCCRPRPRYLTDDDIQALLQVTLIYQIQRTLKVLTPSTTRTKIATQSQKLKTALPAQMTSDEKDRLHSSGGTECRGRILKRSLPY